MDSLNCYIVASSVQDGALGIFHVYGVEQILRERLDAFVCSKKGERPGNPLCQGGLRWGWLRAGDGRPVDEVMTACPAGQSRVLMTHGGKAIRTAIVSFLEEAGFTGLTLADFLESFPQEKLIQPLLSGCVTEGQAASVLDALRCAKQQGRPLQLAPEILAVHRVVLAGAPNAGKSSLLNILSGYRRAFVDPEAGATRDVVDELVDVAGYAVMAGDLPGFQGDGAGLEAEAWRLAEKRLDQAEIIWFICDSSKPWEEGAEQAAEVIAAALTRRAVQPVVSVLLNKADLPSQVKGEPWRRFFPNAPAITINCLPDGNALHAIEVNVRTLLGLKNAGLKRE